MKNMTLYFITGNKGKLEEAQAILPNVEGVEFDLPEIQSLDPQEVITEKLNEAIKKHGGEFFIEDTSFYIHCLNGFPGPLIKWMLESLGLKGITDLVAKYEDKRVTVKTVVGYTSGKNSKNLDKNRNNNDIHFFVGELHGTIPPEPRGDMGFGWDKIFIPEGSDKTLGEWDRSEKNKISMRKNALEKLHEFLENKEKR